MSAGGGGEGGQGAAGLQQWALQVGAACLTASGLQQQAAPKQHGP